MMKITYPGSPSLTSPAPCPLSPFPVFPIFKHSSAAWVPPRSGAWPRQRRSVVSVCMTWWLLWCTSWTRAQGAAWWLTSKSARRTTSARRWVHMSHEHSWERSQWGPGCVLEFLTEWSSHYQPFGSCLCLYRVSLTSSGISSMTSLLNLLIKWVAICFISPFMSLFVSVFILRAL